MSRSTSRFLKYGQIIVDAHIDLDHKLMIDGIEYHAKHEIINMKSLSSFNFSLSQIYP